MNLLLKHLNRALNGELQVAVIITGADAIRGVGQDAVTLATETAKVTDEILARISAIQYSVKVSIRNSIDKAARLIGKTAQMGRQP